MIKYYEHRGVHIEVFYLENGACYAAFDITDLHSYESDNHENVKDSLKQAVKKIDELLSGDIK